MTPTAKLLLKYATMMTRPSVLGCDGNIHCWCDIRCLVGAGVANGNAACERILAICDDAISCQEQAGVANGNAAIDICDYDDQTSCLHCDCTAARWCGLFCGHVRIVRWRWNVPVVTVWLAAS